MATVTISRANTTPSNLQRRAACPGSAKLEAGLPDDDSNDARVGRLLHRYFAHPEYDRRLLTPEEQDVLKTADGLLADVLYTIHEGTGVPLPSAEPRMIVEETITGLDGRLVGTPDQVFIWKHRSAALVNDLKSGFFVVERAELNLQLRGYAVLVAENYIDFNRVFVSILQPRLWRPSERVTVAQYDLKDVARARDQITAIIDTTERDDAPLIAGEEQCRYCKAKLICPAFGKAIGLPLAQVKTEADLSKLKREAEIEKIVKSCNDEQLEALYKAKQLAALIDEPVSAEVRRRIRAGQFDKYVLGKEGEKRSIKSVSKAIAKLALSGIASREELVEYCSLSLGKLEEHYRSKHRGVTWDQARSKIDQVLKSVLAREPYEPKILPKKKTK